MSPLPLQIFDTCKISAWGWSISLLMKCFTYIHFPLNNTTCMYIADKKIQTLLFRMSVWSMILLFRMSVWSMIEFNEKLTIFKCPSVGNFVIPLGWKINVPLVLSFVFYLCGICLKSVRRVKCIFMKIWNTQSSYLSIIM